MQIKKMRNSKLLLSFLLLFFFISFASSSLSLLNNGHRCSTEQSVALLLFKQNLFSINDTSNVYGPLCQDHLGSGHYPFMMSWNSGTDCCLWDRITCDHFTGDVISVDLSCGMLQGTIHPNTTLFHLPHLQTLNLAYNDFSGSHLSNEIGRYANSLTHLNVSFCRFTGQIPPEISFLSKLVSLDLSWNWFGFRLDPRVFNDIIQNCTQLKEMSLGGVDISLVLPTNLNISSSFKLLDLRHSGLQGKLPDNIFNLPFLEKLDLSYNYDLTGSLPKINSSIPLNWLSLSDTGLSGEMPDSIGHLKSLNELYLSSTELAGEIPNLIGHLKFLNNLDLSQTNLSGKIPDSIGHLESLNSLDLSNTKLSGQIPDSIGHLKSLNTLQLSKCGFMGPIPKSIGKIRGLTHLYLSDNMLNGTLPTWLFTLPLLESIFLDNNMFTGSIPSELFACQSLKQLKLGYNQLVGKIDVLNHVPMVQSFQGLINLTYLDLSFNNFIGKWELDTLLSSLVNLETLHLSYSGLSVVTNSAYRYVNPDFFDIRLASCKLSVFPESLRQMKYLNFLDLSNNQIKGCIPDWAGEIVGDQLQYLNISHNFMTGPFPLIICNMSDPYMLDMSNNRFSGSIPQCFGNIISYAVMVDLGNNHFHGNIPDAFEDCQLNGLILKGNRLQGEVPRSLSTCQSLKVLDLGNNNLNGTFPGWLGDLTMLQVLVLKSNKFYGQVEFSSAIELPFSSLRVLDLSHNRFVGSIPQKTFGDFRVILTKLVKKGSKPEYMKLLDKYYSVTVVVKGLSQTFSKISVDYTIVDLSYNRFENEIPDMIGSLTSLIVLDLSHNILTGQIPHSLGNLSQIESLDLSCNQLIGEIPQSLAYLTFLEFLNLSQNHLVGRIPRGTQFSTFTTSFDGNPELCGFPLPKHCGHPSSPQLKVGGDTDSWFTWEVVMLGYGCGTLFGLAVGCLMLSTGRPKWFNAIAHAGEHMIQIY